jgi:hypothetical protein
LGTRCSRCRCQCRWQYYKLTQWTFLCKWRTKMLNIFFLGVSTTEGEHWEKQRNFFHDHLTDLVKIPLHRFLQWLSLKGLIFEKYFTLQNRSSLFNFFLGWRNRGQGISRGHHGRNPRHEEKFGRKGDTVNEFCFLQLK